MNKHGRWQVAVGTWVLLLLLLVPVAPATASPTPLARADGCKAVNVVGKTIHDARAALKKNGCLPGTAKDGRHYVVRTMCAPDDDFGKIVKQEPRGQLLGPRQVLQLWSGVRASGPDGVCNQLPEPTNNKYDGRYSGTFTVGTSTNENLYPLGAQVSGIEFIVSGNRLDGEVEGSINAVGVSADAVYDLDGTRCVLTPGSQMTFGNGSANASGVTCREGGVTVTGRFTAWTK